jgi:hypothetical protein
MCGQMKKELIALQAEVAMNRPAESLKVRGQWIESVGMFLFTDHGGSFYVSAADIIPLPPPSHDLQVSPRSLATRIDDAIYIKTAGGAAAGEERMVMFHLPSQQWSCGVAVLALSGDIAVRLTAHCIMLLGGNDPSVSIFDTRTQKWVTVSSSRTLRSNACATVFYGAVYTFGGTIEDHDTKSSYTTRTCEVYEAGDNGKTAAGDGRWLSLASMPVARSRSIAINCNDSILIMGGVADDGSAMHTIDQYVPSRNEWRTLIWQTPHDLTHFTGVYHPATTTLMIAGIAGGIGRVYMRRAPFHMHAWVRSASTWTATQFIACF